MARKAENIQALLWSLAELQFLQFGTEQSQPQDDDREKNQGRDRVFSEAIVSGESTLFGNEFGTDIRGNKQPVSYAGENNQGRISKRNNKKYVSSAYRRDRSNQIRKRFLRERLRRWISQSDKRNPNIK